MTHLRNELGGVKQMRLGGVVTLRLGGVDFLVKQYTSNMYAMLSSCDDAFV